MSEPNDRHGRQLPRLEGGRSMIDLTDHLLPHAEAMDTAFSIAACSVLPPSERPTRRLREARAAFAHIRGRFGLLQERPAPLLTFPGHNAKLNKAKDPSYGLTLQHHVQRVSPKLVINACPSAGDCVKVCVLDNGMGRFDKVQEARRAKTMFLAEHPVEFAYMLGWELAKAQMRDGPILFRPNVNSDVGWQLLMPSMVNGDHLPGVQLYGYTKRPEVLETNGWLGNAYRVAYSWNETSHEYDYAVFEFLKRGGSVAVVTGRRKGAPVLRFFHLGAFTYDSWENRVLDADLTDEWIFEESAIGDLSAKGKARKLIGKSGFVVST